MESLKSQSQLNPTTTQIIVSCATAGESRGPAKLCAARLTEACLERGGQIEPERGKRKNARYCRACAYPARLARNAARKRELRRQLGWRPYYHLYAPIPNAVDKEAERKKLHRHYMRAYRARKGSARSK